MDVRAQLNVETRLGTGTLWVRPEAASAGLARRHLSTELDGSGLSPQVLDDLLLIVTELISNALRHADAMPSGDIGVNWLIDAGSITVSVTDGGGNQLPHTVDAAPDATSGRGMAIVAALADDWGIRHAEGVVTVWARLAT